MEPVHGMTGPHSETACLEICVDDAAGLRAAVTGGADRIELCSALAVGGLTPSAEFVAKALELRLPVHVMVRPRAGDFEYDEDEIALMAGEMRRLGDVGAAGVVTGALDSTGRLDVRALEIFREAALGLKLTLHRAVDLAPDLCEAVRIAADLGYDYVLTSGGAKSAIEGRDSIRRMIEEAGRRVTIIAGGGITAENVVVLVRQDGVAQIHASATRVLDWADPRLADFGFAIGPRRLTDPAKVAALKHAIASA